MTQGNQREHPLVFLSDVLRKQPVEDGDWLSVAPLTVKVIKEAFECLVENRVAALHGKHLSLLAWLTRRPIDFALANRTMGLHVPSTVT